MTRYAAATRSNTVCGLRVRGCYQYALHHNCSVLRFLSPPASAALLLQCGRTWTV